MASIEWHPRAFKQFTELDRAVQTRIQRVLSSLEDMDEVRPKLIPYEQNSLASGSFVSAIIA